MKNLTIDPEFQALIPPLAPEELAQLEANIIKDGCRDPLVTWQGTLIDGHNRHDICTRHGIEFETVVMEFADREAVMDWMDANQLGRRNLSPDAFKLALGRRYNRTKKAEHDGGKGKPRTGDQIEPNLRTAAKLAAEHSVSEATVKRAGKFAEEVAETPELQKAINDRVPIKKIKKEKAKTERQETIKKKSEAAVKTDSAQGFIQGNWAEHLDEINIA